MRKLILLLILAAAVGGAYIYLTPTTDPVTEVYEFIQTRGVTEINVEIVDEVMHIRYSGRGGSYQLISNECRILL
jgi:hypothetical protein